MAQTLGFSTGWVMSQRILLMLVIAVAVSSCNRKAEGQTVAIVNNEEITASELNAELAKSPATAGSDSKGVRAAALQGLIDRKLLVQQAKSDGLDKSPEYLNQQRRLNDELLINMLLSRRLNTSQVPSADEINRFEANRPGMFASREIWTLQQLLYPLPKDKAVIAKIGAAQTLDEVAQVLTASGIQFTRETKKLDTAILPPVIYKQISGIKQGEPFVVPGSDKAVASVIVARDPAPLPADQARQVALTVMKRENAQKIIQDRVKSLRTTAKIQYQPGFEPPKS
jgi:EpsD family peptidyl-prolyl cis-trans isomerase